jgi:hypothetical protein
MPPGTPIVAPAGAWRVDRRGRPGSLGGSVGEARGRRPGPLWKCRGRGNHRPISTAAWKSRTEREIPTFPQADHRSF